MINKGTGGLGNQRTSRDHPDYSIIKIGQNTQKSPGDFMRLGFIETSVRNRQLTPEKKISEKGNIIISSKRAQD